LNFDKQILTLSNALWAIEIEYLSSAAKVDQFNADQFDTVLSLNEINRGTGSLSIKATSNYNTTGLTLIEGIDGGTYLHASNESDSSQSVKLNENTLVLSLGTNFASFNVESQEIIWNIKPDLVAIFEFYDLEDDYLLRGELEMFRIDNNGNIKWKYAGKDIWVNNEGKKEVQIEENKIRLIDFEGNEYVIDYFGKTTAEKSNE
jgi:hypothetical protein